MHIRLIIPAFFFVFGVTVCRANLGDTEAQCIAKYGAESDVTTDLGYRQVGDKAVTFNLTKPATGPLNIRVTFLNGLSCHEVVTNADPSTGLSLDQMKAVLDSQGKGLKWEKGKTLYRTNGGFTYGIVDWQRSDGAVGRYYVSGKASSENHSGQVDVSTKQYATAQSFYDKQNGD